MRVMVIETQRMVPLGALASPLIEQGVELVYWRTTEEAPPAALKGIAGVIALGGAANPDQDAHYPWLDHERRLLREALERRLPAISLCLGGELSPRCSAANRVRSRDHESAGSPSSAISAPATTQSGGSCRRGSPGPSGTATR